MDEIQNTESVTSGPTTDTSSTSLSDDRMASEMSAVWEAANAREPSYEDESTSDYSQHEATPAPRGATRPQSLSPAAQPHWDATPEEMRQWISEREYQSTQKINELGQQLGELRRAGQSADSADFGDVLARFDSVLPRGPDGAPVPVSALLEESLTLAALLRGTPEQRAMAIHTVARQAGIDLGQLAHDPQLVAHQEQQIRQHMRAELAQRQHSEHVARLNTVNALVAQFAEGKDYLPQLENEIANQIELIKMNDPNRVMNDPVGTLEEAHRRAIKATDFELPEKKLERMRKAAEAKRLASLNVKSSAGRSPRTVSNSIWDADMWSDAYDRASGR
jgi:hypothetical protein